MEEERQQAEADKEKSNEEYLAEQMGSLFGGSESFSIQIAAERVCRTAADAKRMIGRKGQPVRLENAFLQLEAEVSRRSEEEFFSGNSMGKTFESLEQAGLKRDDILTLHYTAMGNISDLFANGERMKFERAYKKKDVRKGMIHVFSPFTVKGVNGEYEADIELLIHQEANVKPLTYVLAVGIEKRSQRQAWESMRPSQCR